MQLYIFQNNCVCPSVWAASSSASASASASSTKLLACASPSSFSSTTPTPLSSAAPAASFAPLWLPTLRLGSPRSPAASALKCLWTVRRAGDKRQQNGFFVHFVGELCAFRQQPRWWCRAKRRGCASVNCVRNDFSRAEDEGEQRSAFTVVLQKCAVCMIAAIAFTSFELSAVALETSLVLPGLAVLISGPPIKDPNILLRNALPIDNKPIKEVQKALEDVTENLKVPGLKALNLVERNIRQAARALSQNKQAILASVAESKNAHGEELLNKLALGLEEFQKIVEEKNRDSVVLKQKDLLNIVGDVEEDMVSKFPFEIPEEHASKPLLKGRATVEMKVKVKENPNLQDIVFRMVVDGYNAPVTAGNFVDLVERHFYDGMEIQRADGFVVQTGDPDGPAEGFVDPSTGKVRKIPLEIMVEGDTAPIYDATLEELGRYRDRPKLPFNAFGTLAMARDEFDDNSASSQIFWLLKESELTPSSANILDGRYAVFGYVTENQDYLADLKVGDMIESMKVVTGLDNLTNPSYKIVG
eukprot:c25601_g1_i3 orf=109-1698(+)